MNEEFNNLPWHDAILKEIIIDRETQDVISVSVIWPEDIDTNKYALIEFFSCYAFRSKMNFGMFGPDSIMTASCENTSEELDQLRSIWKEMRIDLSEVDCFRIETNTTGSEIKIFAKSFKITNKLAK